MGDIYTPVPPCGPACVVHSIPVAGYYLSISCGRKQLTVGSSEYVLSYSEMPNTDGGVGMRGGDVRKSKK